MSFGSHNLESETDPVTAAPSAWNAPSCPLSRAGAWASWLVPWRRPVGPRRKWAVATAWGAKWTAALWVVACVKCVVIYIVVPSVIVWLGTGGLEKNHDAATPLLVESVAVPHQFLGEGEGCS